MKLKPSVHAKKNLACISEVNRRDEKQANLYYPLDAPWSYELDDCRDISLAGVRALIRVLKVAFSSVETTRSSARYCSVARASYRSIQYGAYSSPTRQKDAKLISKQLAMRNAAYKVIPTYLRAAFINRQRVYFAHPMQLYGTTGESLVKQAIRETAPDWVIIDPSKMITKTGAEAIREGLGIIERCDALVFTGVGNFLSKGVFEEVRFALKKSIPVSFRFNGEFKRIKDMRHFEIINPSDWNYYVEVSL